MLSLKRKFSLYFTTVLVGFVCTSQWALGLTLGPDPSVIEQQKYENLFKSPEQGEGLGQPVENVNDQPVRLNLNLPPEAFANQLQSQLSQQRSAEVFDAFALESDERISIPLHYDHLPEKQRIVAEAIRNISVGGIVTFAWLFSLPQDVTNWPDDKSFSELLHEYDDNVKAGPVVDKDSWVFNYFIHPMSGAYLYLVLRKQGFTQMESFGFAFFASTVMWEYGLEAIAEIPSIQDLIITPVAGAVLGEMFHQWSLKLQEQDYRLSGSRKLGRVVHAIINPVDGFNRGMNRLFKSDYFQLKRARIAIQDQNAPFRRFGGEEELYLDQDLTVGIRFLFQFR